MIPAATCPLSARDGTGLAIDALAATPTATNSPEILPMDAPKFQLAHTPQTIAQFRLNGGAANLQLAGLLEDHVQL